MFMPFNRLNPLDKLKNILYRSFMGKKSFHPPFEKYVFKLPIINNFQFVLPINKLNEALELMWLGKIAPKEVDFIWWGIGIEKI